MDKYYYSKDIKNNSFNEVKEKVIKSLKEHGFGIITEIDLKETFKQKLDKQFKPYHILGACNPSFAMKAIESEDKIGLMLPCNVVIIQNGSSIEIAAIDPIASMQAVNNKSLEGIAQEIRSLLQQAIKAVAE